MSKITISLIKADVGGWPGHATVHPALKSVADSMLAQEKASGRVIDYKVMSVGDDLELLMSHRNGVDNADIHGLAWEVFCNATEKAKELKLYGAGQDMLCDAFSGNVKGMGPGVAELEFQERTADPLVAFMMDKTEPGAFNFPIYKIFADPFNTAGLVIDPAIHQGFIFEIWDILENKSIFMKCPEEMYDVLALVGAKSRYVIKRVFPKPGKLPEDEAVATISTEKLYHIAGAYVGKDDPVALVRCQSGLPALGEVLEPFSIGHLVSGWMRGSHNGPLMPCAFEDACCTRFDGPPRVIAAGFQIADGVFVGPVDLFKDKAFDLTRQRVLEVADYMRRHGPFEPHRLPMEEMEYTTLPNILKELGGRFKKIE